MAISRAKLLSGLSGATALAAVAGASGGVNAITLIKRPRLVTLEQVHAAMHKAGLTGIGNRYGRVPYNPSRQHLVVGPKAYDHFQRERAAAIRQRIPLTMENCGDENGCPPPDNTDPLPPSDPTPGNAPDGSNPEGLKIIATVYANTTFPPVTAVTNYSPLDPNNSGTYNVSFGVLGGNMYFLPSPPNPAPLWNCIVADAKDVIASAVAIAGYITANPAQFSYFSVALAQSVASLNPFFFVASLLGALSLPELIALAGAGFFIGSVAFSVFRCITSAY